MDSPHRALKERPRLRAVAVLFVSGLILLVVGAVGAFVWTPLAWCAAAGLVVIAAALTASG